MEKQDPRSELVKDKRCLVCIRVANIDAFSAREAGTVRGNLNCVQRDYSEAKEALGLTEPYPPMGPFPLRDDLGMKPAVMSLHSSLRKGRYAGHLQWDSMRATPTAWANLYGAVPVV